jgi:hypothetical protein
LKLIFLTVYGVTNLDRFRVRRRDRAGGVIHEYRLVALVFGTHNGISMGAIMPQRDDTDATPPSASAHQGLGHLLKNLWIPLYMAVAMAFAYVNRLTANGQPTAYLFHCLHCGTHLAFSDFT